jgi:NAD(P)-dependent dehydrogenase (short-subunit alcohol dehydrogenase family)
MQGLLKGRVAIVTGGGQGNGREIAIGLAEQGARLAVLDLNGDNAAAVAAEISAQHGKAVGYAVDVRDENEVARIAKETAVTLGPASILINNAGVFLRGTVTDPDGIEKLRDTLDINVMGPALLVRAFHLQLVETKGCIINVASSSSFIARPNSAAYAASKGALKQLTTSWATDLAPHGVRVNAIAPGFIDTPLTKATQSNPAFMDMYLGRVPMGRIGTTRDLVGPVVFLASDMSAYVTGVVIPVDGGFIAT